MSHLELRPASDHQQRVLQAACALFLYVSWVHWPRRSFAVSREFAAFRRQGVVLAGAMVVLSGLGFLLGIPVLIMWIIYWVKIAGFSAKIADPGAFNTP